MMVLILLPVLLLLTIFRVTNDAIDYLPVLAAAMTNVLEVNRLQSMMIDEL